MEVSVIYTTQLKAALGRSSDVVELQDGANVLDAIRKLAANEAGTFDRFVLADGGPLPSVLVSVNEQQVDFATKLSDGDQLTLLSAISGG